MKLLFDENLSPTLSGRVRAEFPGSSHVSNVGLRGAEDIDIWSYAAQNGFMIVSKDTDFADLSFLSGAPPKVLWLSVGNAGTVPIATLLLGKVSAIHAFDADPESALMTLELPDRQS